MNALKDRAFMEMAYGLAERAKGWASPNPNVGAVIVKRDAVVGFGYHEKPGKPHAEIIALEKAGNLSKNATAYLTLEPCTHWGRTPPCIDRILQSGLRRIVVSSLDPNPLVYKKGIARIIQSGMDAAVGLLAEKNHRLNEAYFKYITRKTPFVTVKAAISMDGKMATQSRQSQWISSPEAREYTHLIRGEYDAVMVGIDTFIQDDPLLTVRHRNWKGKRTARLILDSKLRFPLDSRICSTLARGDIIVFTTNQARPAKAESLIEKGIRVIRLSGSSSRICLEEVLTWLGKHEISSVLVEGGSRLITSIFEKKLADKIFLMLSPKLIGGKKAPSLFEGNGADRIKDALCLKNIHTCSIGDESVIEGYF